MKYITRTIKSTTVYPKIIVVKNGKLTTEEKPEFKVDGEAKESDIIKMCRKLYGKLNNYVFEVETEERKFKLDVDTFMQYATEVNADDEIDEN